MADLRESFPVLEDATGAGVALSKSIAGDAAAAKLGLTAFAAKDSAGNLALIPLTSEGKLPVSFDGAGVPKSGAAKIAGTATEATVATVALSTGKTYGKISFQVACFREAVFRLVQVDATSETEIGYALVGPGSYTASVDLGAREITGGATGTQKLDVRGANLDKLSDLRASVSALEFEAGA